MRLSHFGFRIYRFRNNGFPMENSFRKRQHVGTDQTLSVYIWYLILNGIQDIDMTLAAGNRLAPAST